MYPPNVKIDLYVAMLISDPVMSNGRNKNVVSSDSRIRLLLLNINPKLFRSTVPGSVNPFNSKSLSLPARLYITWPLSGLFLI